jgi:hypothetical protein
MSDAGREAEWDAEQGRSDEDRRLEIVEAQLEQIIKLLEFFKAQFERYQRFIPGKRSARSMFGG